jgi:2-oxoglutarate ferredoxin oxidoreductase subunit alpha
MKAFRRVVLPELNKGQLAMMLRAKYLIDVESLSQVNGQPFRSHDIENRLTEILGEAK